ncbi:PREDICTED: putative F-box protein At1g67623 [Nicotiana attenuata]|uniref:putative F-box protein At1g67623 n=1 Tax=Nicotiana attenuata TaxID=49451 RepID=UPI00090472E2|nr:PREDICTED: putative F-box protein At1g67623 [Nicotiana attenuata]
MAISHSSREITKRRPTKHNKKLKKSVVNSSNIKSLPNDLLSQVIARVASSSFTDYINAKLSCKIFNEISNDRYIYHHMSMEKFPIGPSWKRDKEDKEKKLSLFMRMCGESGNAEALYRKGVVDFFRKERPTYAIECLVKAAETGHLGAQYVISIIQVFIGGEFKQNGITAIGKMKANKPMRRALGECRKNLVEILNSIWVLNPIFLAQNPYCCTLHHKRSYKNKWRQWPSFDSDDEDEDEDEDHFSCDACSCDEEVAYLVKILPLY